MPHYAPGQQVADSLYLTTLRSPAPMASPERTVSLPRIYSPESQCGPAEREKRPSQVPAVSEGRFPPSLLAPSLQGWNGPGGWDSAITRTEEGGTRTGAAARGLLRVLPWHPIHVQEGGDAAGLHCHQIPPNTCRGTKVLRRGGVRSREGVTHHWSPGDKDYCPPLHQGVF